MRLMLLLEKEEWEWLRKEPGLLQAFKDMHKNGASESELVQAYRQYLDHKLTFRQMEIRVHEMSKLEEFTDALQEVELYEKVTRFLNQLPSHIRNDAKQRREELTPIIQDWPEEDWNQNFIKKSNRYRTYNELLAGMRLGQKNVTSQELEVKEGIKQDPNATIILDQPGILICSIKDWETSVRWGSTQWCISRENTDSYWRSYVPEKLGKQYFLWDFETDNLNLSRIGITMYPDESIVAHDNRDYDCRDWAKQQWWFKYLKPHNKETILNNFNGRQIYNAVYNKRIRITDYTFTYEEAKKLLQEESRLINFIELSDQDLLKIMKDGVSLEGLPLTKRLQLIRLGKTPERLEFEATHSLFVWNSKEEFVELDNGTYKKLELPESVIYIEDPTSYEYASTLSGMKMRAKYVRLTTWGAWINNEIFDEDDMEVYKEDPYKMIELFKDDFMRTEIFDKIKFRL